MYRFIAFVEAAKNLVPSNVKGYGKFSTSESAKVYGTWRIPTYSTILLARVYKEEREY